MKICAACSKLLQKEKFSKKQWQAKQHRRCKECIVDNREVNLEADAPNDEPPLPCYDGEGASDEDLFKQPPPQDECPICMLPLPSDGEGQAYHECCGKSLCAGCMHADDMRDERCLCPFCRTPAANSDKKYIERLKKRAGGDDAVAIYTLGCFSCDGMRGLRQNYRKANKLWLRAGELGDALAYHNLANSYYNGKGVQRNEEKANHYYELAAIGGNVKARYNLGIFEYNAGNMNRAVKHWMISASAGHDKSLKEIRECFMDGHATKDDFEKALRAHKEAADEMKSDQRDAAAAFLSARAASSGQS